MSDPLPVDSQLADSRVHLLRRHRTCTRKLLLRLIKCKRRGESWGTCWSSQGTANTLALLEVLAVVAIGIIAAFIASKQSGLMAKQVDLAGDQKRVGDMQYEIAVQQVKIVERQLEQEKRQQEYQENRDYTPSIHVQYSSRSRENKDGCFQFVNAGVHKVKVLYFVVEDGAIVPQGQDGKGLDLFPFAASNFHGDYPGVEMNAQNLVIYLKTHFIPINENALVNVVIGIEANNGKQWEYSFRARPSLAPEGQKPEIQFVVVPGTLTPVPQTSAK